MSGICTVTLRCCRAGRLASSGGGGWGVRYVCEIWTRYGGMYMIYLLMVDEREGHWAIQVIL